MITSDLDVFAWVIQHLHHGGSYYAVMGQALRQGPGPAGSLFNWRPPLLYVLLAWWPGTVTSHWGVFLMTELWAGLAIMSASLTAKPAPRLSILLTLLAGMLRELALPYVLIRAVCGWKHQGLQWRRVWFILAIYYGMHCGFVRLAQLPTDTVGPSWLAFQGMPFLLAAVTPNPFTLVCGMLVGGLLWVVAVWAAALFGRLALEDRLTLGAYVLAFLIIGRAEPAHSNAYWGFLVLPLQAVCLWRAGMERLDRLMVGR